jgi:hypothetical protein
MSQFRGRFFVKRLLVVLLLPWWLLILLLPFVLVFWVVVGAMFLVVGIVALVVAVVRGLVTHRVRKRLDSQTARYVESARSNQVEIPDGTRAGPNREKVLAEVTPTSAAASPPSGPPADLPIERKQQIATEAYEVLEPVEFVKVMHDLFSALGYYNATVVPGSMQGTRVLTMVDPSLEPMLVLCESYVAGSTAGADVVSEALGLQGQYPGHRLAVVSLNPFTDQAKALAADRSASLYDLNRVLELTDRAGWLRTSATPQSV